jgi:hypothetical protein
MVTRQCAGGSGRWRVFQFRNAAVRQWLGRCFLWMAVALVLYVLSTGPVVRLMFEGVISEQVVETVYAPFRWLEHTKVGQVLLELFIEWYGEKLWGWGIEIVLPPG